MSANLFGERFVGRQPAWHHLGKTFDQPMTAAEAFEFCGLNYHIQKAPLFADVLQSDGSTSRMRIPDQVALMRSPTTDDPVDRFLGTASDGYEVMQNDQLARIIDTLTNEWPVETCGALGNGETIFTALDAGTANPLNLEGEELHNYWSVVDNRDGRTGLWIGFTPVRMVCTNTVSLGQSQAWARVSLPHIKGLTDAFTFRVNLMSKLQSVQNQAFTSFDVMAKAGLEITDAEKMIEQVYPYPTKPAKVTAREQASARELEVYGDSFVAEMTSAQEAWLYYCNRVNATRAEALFRYERQNDESPAIAGTAYGLFQAVVENEDFRDGPQGLFASALWGERSRTKGAAFAMALQYAKKTA